MLGFGFVGRSLNPRGSIYTTIMELAPKRPSPLWFWGPNSIIVVYMGISENRGPSYSTLNRRILIVRTPE